MWYETACTYMDGFLENAGYQLTDKNQLQKLLEHVTDMYIVCGFVYLWCRYMCCGS